MHQCAATALAGLMTTAAGIWSLTAPRSFAEFVNFAFHEHFLHDVGAFQIGIGAMLLLSIIWSDALATVLTGFLIANTVHAVNHVLDVHLGGSIGQAWGLGALSLLIAAALVLRLRQLGYVVGEVTSTASPALTPFVRQKTINLTTYRKDGRPGSTPVSIVVDGDCAYIRSFEKSIKTRRLQRNPAVALAASTGLGKPTAPGQLHGRMRRLHGAEYRHAGRLLTRKYPLLHGVLVPLAHRVGRAKTGRTVHFELTPVDG